MDYRGLALVYVFYNFQRNSQWIGNFNYNLQKEITAIAHCKTLAIDCRGHGDTHTDNEELLAYDTLAQ